MRNLTKTAVVATALTVGIAGTASASATLDPSTGYGFVGKGDVQSAFPSLKNNAAIQDVLSLNPQAVKFSSAQAAQRALFSTASQAGTQSGSQRGSQALTLSVSQSVTEHYSQDLTCEKDNGAIIQRHREGDRSGARLGVQLGTREGSRDASRDASRAGTRVGFRTGSLNGTLNSALNGDPRQTKGQNQFTGFNLSGFSAGPDFTESGVSTWGADSFGDWGSYSAWGSFGTWGSYGTPTYGEATYGAATYSGGVTWGDWDALANEDPATCLQASDHIHNIVDSGAVLTGTSYGDPVDGVVAEGETTEGTITEGTITEGTITYGATDKGAITATGPAIVSATYAGVTKALS